MNKTLIYVMLAALSATPALAQTAPVSAYQAAQEAAQKLNREASKSESSQVSANQRLDRAALEPMAARGDVAAVIQLAALKLNGEGGSKDVQAATELYRYAAGKGHPESQYILGRLLLQPGATVDSVKEAVGWIHSAARSGYGPAISDLSVIVNAKFVDFSSQKTSEYPQYIGAGKVDVKVLTQGPAATMVSDANRAFFGKTKSETDDGITTDPAYAFMLMKLANYADPAWEAEAPRYRREAIARATWYARTGAMIKAKPEQEADWLLASWKVEDSLKRDDLNKVATEATLAAAAKQRN